MKFLTLKFCEHHIVFHYKQCECSSILEIMSEFNPCFSRCAKWHPFNMNFSFYLKVFFLNNNFTISSMNVSNHSCTIWMNRHIHPTVPYRLLLWLSMWVFVYKPNFICLHENKSIIRFWIRLSKEAFHNITYFGSFDTCLSNI